MTAARASVALALGVLVAGLAACAEDPVATVATVATVDGPTAPPSPTEGGTGVFVDVTERWGLDFVHDAGLTPEKHLPETMGAGGALLDADEDGDLDLYLVQGGSLPLPATRTDRRAEPKNRLFANRGDGHLTDVTAASGDAAHAGYGMGCAAGDTDGDGHEDLFVTNLGPDVLLMGDGRASFRDRTAAAGLGDERWTTGALFFDADADGDLDLYVTGYLAVDLEHPSWCGDRGPGMRSYCHPDHYPGIADRFWRNKGDGTFEDATRSAGLSDSLGKGLGAIATDLDDDGDLDLYVANDSVENRLWINAGDGTFTDGTLLSGTGVNSYGATEAGMGLAAGDVDGDLRIDLYVTNFDNESHTLYRNLGEGLFEDDTIATGLEGPSRLPVGFGTVMVDFDHDGDLDIAVANGHIIDNIHLYHDGKTHAQRALYFENRMSGDGGRFRDASGEVGALCSEPFVGRALLAGDLDGDLDLDLVLTQCGGPTRIFANELARGDAWLLHGLPAGTRVEYETSDDVRRVREAGGAPSYCGRGAPETSVTAPAGVGLRSLRVRVPDGNTGGNTDGNRGRDKWREAAWEGDLVPGRYSVDLDGPRVKLTRTP